MQAFEYSVTLKWDFPVSKEYMSLVLNHLCQKANLVCCILKVDDICQLPNDITSVPRSNINMGMDDGLKYKDVTIVMIVFIKNIPLIPKTSHPCASATDTTCTLIVPAGELGSI